MNWPSASTTVPVTAHLFCAEAAMLQMNIITVVANLYNLVISSRCNIKPRKVIGLQRDLQEMKN